MKIFISIISLIAILGLPSLFQYIETTVALKQMTDIWYIPYLQAVVSHETTIIFFIVAILFLLMIKFKSK